ncbi:hypothetical protein BaRGS_00027513 [Batillaria attramentaria]|uniref:Uncharacterized protein n=1 Tax=Batillaria attramentaria TaxID=370345 RepID=A0ABD0K2Q2_9CAEN
MFETARNLVLTESVLAVPVAKEDTVRGGVAQSESVHVLVNGGDSASLQNGWYRFPVMRSRWGSCRTQSRDSWKRRMCLQQLG